MAKNILKSLIIAVLAVNILSVIQAQEISSQNLIKDAKESSMKGNFSKAAELYEEIIKKYPESAQVEEALFWLGYSYEAMGNTKQAIASYDQMLNKFPKGKFGADALRKKANILIEGNNFKQAAETLETLISKYPKSSYANDANSELGDIYGYKMNDFKKAVIAFKRYKASGIEKADMDFNIRFFENNQDFDNEPLKMYCAGKQQSEDDKLEKAEGTFKKIIVNYPKSKVVDDTLLLLGQNEISKAIRLYKNTPLMSEEQKNEFLKYYQAAADYYNQVIRDYPKNETAAQAKYYLAMIYDWDRMGGLNNFEKAMKEYKTVIDEHPGTYWGEKAKQRLEYLKKIY
ncbi:MAG: tetratricopeptide repeat protein [bacterium]